MFSVTEETRLFTKCRPPLSETKMTDTLQILDTLVGDGVEAKPGMRITVHYTGKLESKTVPSSSL